MDSRGQNGIFFPKIKVKSGKNENWPKTVKKRPKMDFFCSQTLFATIFYYPGPSNGPKKPFSAFSGDFWSFLVYPLQAQKKVGQNASNRNILA